MIPSFLTGLFFGGRALKRKADESGVSAWFRGALGSIFNKYTGAGLTGAEEATNKFNAEQAQIQRDWETEMSNTAMQRQVSDMQKAGLNPALMYGGAGSSGASTPSGASASGVAPTSGLDPISAILDMALLKAQVENIKADTRQKIAGAHGLEIENTFKPDILAQNLEKGEFEISNLQVGINERLASINRLDFLNRLTVAEIAEVNARADKELIEAANERLKQKGIELSNEKIAEEILSLQAERLLTTANTALAYATANRENKQSGLISVQTVHESFNQVYREKYGVSPDQNAMTTLTGLLGKTSELTSKSIKGLIDSLKRK